MEDGVVKLENSLETNTGGIFKLGERPVRKDLPLMSWMSDPEFSAILWNRDCLRITILSLLLSMKASAKTRRQSTPSVLTLPCLLNRFNIF